MEKIATHIKGFDETLGGGIIKKTITLLAGGPGSGKSILATQLLYNNIMKNNGSGVYICFEESKQNVYDWMKEFGWDLEELEKKKKFMFIEYTPEKIKHMIEEGTGIITTSLEKVNADFVVIDSITSFELMFKDDLQRREALLDLFKLMRKWGATVVLTGEFESDIDEQISVDIEFEVDSIILVYHSRKTDTRDRSLEVLKTRGSAHMDRVVPFSITSKGIEVYPDKRIDYYRRKKEA